MDGHGRLAPGLSRGASAHCAHFFLLGQGGKRLPPSGATPACDRRRVRHGEIRPSPAGPVPPKGSHGGHPAAARTAPQSADSGPAGQRPRRVKVPPHGAPAGAPPLAPPPKQGGGDPGGPALLQPARRATNPSGGVVCPDAVPGTAPISRREVIFRFLMPLRIVSWCYFCVVCVHALCYSCVHVLFRRFCVSA